MLVKQILSSVYLCRREKYLVWRSSSALNCQQWPTSFFFSLILCIYFFYTLLKVHLSPSETAGTDCPVTSWSLAGKEDSIHVKIALQQSNFLKSSHFRRNLSSWRRGGTEWPVNPRREIKIKSEVWRQSCDAKSSFQIKLHLIAAVVNKKNQKEQQFETYLILLTILIGSHLRG